MWKKNDNMMALGEQILRSHDKERFKVSLDFTLNEIQIMIMILFQVKKEDHGNTLEISLAETEDGGEYKCAVSSAGEPRELKHSVNIRGRI